MKIVFLDFDGVLNTSKDYHAYGKACTADPDDPPVSRISIHGKHVHLLFGKEHVRLLNHITNTTGADIVVSSSWRRTYSGYGGLGLADLRALLKLVGVEAKVLGITPTDLHLKKLPHRIFRGHEIEEWLKQHRSRWDIKVYAILDDDSDMLDDQQPYFVKTLSWTGLMPEDAERAIKILSA